LLAVAQRDEHDALLIDLAMLELPPRGVTACICSSVRRPVIALGDDHADVAAALDAGAHDYVVPGARDRRRGRRRGTPGDHGGAPQA
jgi:DNA-binding NarL/FixJ family response regulator